MLVQQGGHLPPPVAAGNTDIEASNAFMKNQSHFPAPNSSRSHPKSPALASPGPLSALALTAKLRGRPRLPEGRIDSTPRYDRSLRRARALSRGKLR
jgi:hypothetical protein